MPRRYGSPRFTRAANARHAGRPKARRGPSGSTEPVPVGPPKHPLHALRTYELNDRRRELERAITGIPADAPVQAGLRRALDAVLAEQEDRARLAGA